MFVTFFPLQRVLLQGVSLLLEIHEFLGHACILFGGLNFQLSISVTLLCTCTFVVVHIYIGDEDFVADPTVSTIVLSGSETRKCVNVNR